MGIEMQKRLLATLIAAVCMAEAAQASTVVNISNFSSFGYGGAVTNQIAGVEFSLIGGPGPTTAPTVGWSGLLTNSVYAGSYPTANILDVKFDGLASNVSFTFNPAGFSCIGCGRGDSFYQAFDINGTLLEQGSLGANYGGFVSISLSSNGIHDLQFNNGTGGTDSWWFGLQSLTATVDSATAVPEPASIALAGLALAGMATISRRRRHS